MRVRLKVDFAGVVGLFAERLDGVLRHRRADAHIDHIHVDVEFEQRVFDQHDVGVDLLLVGQDQFGIDQQIERRQRWRRAWRSASALSSRRR